MGADFRTLKRLALVMNWGAPVMTKNYRRYCMGDYVSEPLYDPFGLPLLVPLPGRVTRDELAGGAAAGRKLADAVVTALAPFRKNVPWVGVTEGEMVAAKQAAASKGTGEAAEAAAAAAAAEAAAAVASVKPDPVAPGVLSDNFEPEIAYGGPRPGFSFRNGPQGLGAPATQLQAPYTDRETISGHHIQIE